MILRGIVFDVDGTLVDTVDLHAHAWHDAIRKWGKDVSYMDVRAQIGKGGDQILPVFFTEEQIKDFGGELTDWRMQRFKAEYLPQAKAFPQVRELFEAIRKRGPKIALASSAKKEELDGYKKLANITDLVDAETNADDVKKTKPHPDIFIAAMEKLRLPPAEAIAVGDSPFDAQAAEKIGLQTVGLLCGGFPENTMREAGCAALYRDPAHLLEHLDDVLNRNFQNELNKERTYA